MKKLLALVLALVMSMSLVTISNAAYSDKADIDLKEAVDVLSAVGVFEGSDGKFDPKANLTREQAAKLVAYLQLSQKSADALVGGNKFTDVAANRWSAGYVDYCATTGVVAGIGNGQFNPTGSLTALQFGKMLLVELGYDAKAEGMVGTDWAINTSKLMAGTKLMDDISGSVNQVLTREKAAQMCLNALEAPMVTYDTKGSTIVVDGTKINFGASVAKYETSTVAKDQNISKEKLTSGEYTVELGEKLYKDLKKNSTTDAFERPATEWMLKAKSIGTYADAADLSYTATVEIGTIYSDLGLSKGIDDSKVTYYEDGRNLSSSWNQDIVKGSKVEKGGNGTLLEVYYNDDAESLTVIAINTYVGKITASYKASTTKDAYVTFTAKTGAGSSYETDDSYSKDDIVLYTYSGKAGDAGVKSMALAEKVTGKMNGFTAEKNVTVDGTTYKKSANGTSITPGMNTSVGKDVSVYLDQYGYAAFVDADDTLQYAVILAYEKGSRLDSPRAKLLFTDGTTKKVDVKALKDADGNAYSDRSLSDYASSASGNSKLNKYDVVSYTVNSDEEYTLTLAADARNADVGSAKITKGIPSLAGTASGDGYNVGTANSGRLYANGKTTFLIYNEATNTVESYVGIANVPTINLTDADDNCAVYVPVGSASAKVVFVAHDGDAVISGNSKSVFFIKGDKNGNPAVNHTEEFGDYYEYDAIIGGEITKIKMAATAANKITATIASQLTKDSKGVYSLVAGYYANATTPTGRTDASVKYVAAEPSHQNDAVVNGTITLAGTPISVADKCEVFVISADGKTISATNVNAIQKDDNDKVWYKTNSDGEVTTIVIQTVDAPGSAGSSSEETYEWEVNANTLRVNLTYSSNTTSVSDVDVMNNAGYALQQAGYVVNAWGGSSSSSITLTTTLTSSGLTAHAYKGNLDITFTVYVAKATA